MKDKEI